jgi:hypothetical protein
VTDADSGEPVLEAKAFPGYGTEPHCWERLDTRRMRDGTFKVVFAEKQDPWRIRVEADGYRPFVSEELEPDFAGPLDVQLKALGAATAISGLVLQPDGQPATGTDVALLTLDHNVELKGARFIRRAEDRLILETDAGGRFLFPPDGMAHTVVAAGNAGFASMSVRALLRPVTIRLQAWGRIEGVVDASARELPVESVDLGVPLLTDCLGRIAFRFPQVKPGDDGRFQFDHVPPIPMLLQLSPGAGNGYLHHQTPVTVTPGGTMRVVIATTGALVTGRFVTVGPEPDWAKYVRFAFLDTGDRLPPMPTGLSDDDRKLAQAEYWNSDVGRAQAVKSRSVKLEVTAEGRFQSATLLPPGTYRLRARIGERVVERPVTIPEPDDEGPQVLDLGSIPVPTSTPTEPE